MAGYYIGNKFKMICGGKKIKKGICGGNVVYSGASPVTYNVDTDTVYIEEVDSGISCLTPTSFAPTKEGYTFLGWKEDTTADSSVLTDKVMGDEPITLYAVFSKTITISYNGNGASSGATASQTDYQYYNNGNVVSPTFVLNKNGFVKGVYSFTKWAISSTSGTQYSAGASVVLSENTTFYAIWTLPSSLVIHTYGGATLSEYVTGLPCYLSVSDSDSDGQSKSTESTKTTPFTLTALAKQQYSTCTFIISYALTGEGRYGTVYARYNGADIAGGWVFTGTGTKTVNISTSSAPGSISVYAKGNVNYAAAQAIAWISKITLSGKK